jgi:hypothetical protein
MSNLKVVSSTVKPSPVVYLLFGRAVVEMDQWMLELRSADDMLAFIRALRGNLHSRRKVLEMAIAARANIPVER